MKLTAKIKLQPTDEQRELLYQTLTTANAACDFISRTAWEQSTFNKYGLQKLTYYDVKATFGLSAQVVIRCLGKVADAYKRFNGKQRKFKKTGAIAYDSRILKYRTDRETVSMWTVGGRQTIPYLAGEHQKALLQHQQGESDLALIRGEWYLFATCDIEAPVADDVTGYLGVDLGIVNIAADNDGETHSGSHVNKVRHRNRNLRKNLQQKGTKSAKRRLRAMSGRESRFVHDTNHCIAKHIVQKAKRTHRGIALEDLKGIRTRAKGRKPQRTALNSWAFADLAAKIQYKARKAGVAVVFVDPAYTSQTCPCCGHTSKSNRKVRDHFSCVECGYAAPADTVGAINIALRGADGTGPVNGPDAVAPGLAASPRL
ncbi:MAG: transposase [Chloroflexota bacterium]